MKGDIFMQYEQEDFEQLKKEVKGLFEKIPLENAFLDFTYVPKGDVLDSLKLADTRIELFNFLLDKRKEATNRETYTRCDDYARCGKPSQRWLWVIGRESIKCSW